MVEGAPEEAGERLRRARHRKASESSQGAPAEEPEAHPNGRTRRALRSNSPLAILQILREPALRRSVLGDRLIEFDSMAGRVTIGREFLTRADLTDIQTQVELHFDANAKGGGLKFSLQQIENAVHQVARARPFHPVQEYLAGLRWDGESRLERFASEVLGIPETSVEVIEVIILARWFISAVARARQPGCKVKTMLILQGEQDSGKSELMKALVPDRRFASDQHIDISSKEAELMLARVWIHEWGELKAMQGHTQEAVKNFISADSGHVILKYSNDVTILLRSSVMVGTANPKQILSDPTGLVRYHPIQVGEVDLRKAAAWRDQLWAEAQVLYDLGEQWWLTREESALLVELQRGFMVSDAWDEPVLKAVGELGGNDFSMAQVMERALEKKPGYWAKSEEHRMAEILGRLGFENSGRRYIGTQKVRTWVRKVVDQ